MNRRAGRGRARRSALTGTAMRRDNRGSPMLFVALAWSLAQVPEPPAPVADVVWVAPPGCPGRAELIAGIERRRGKPLVPGLIRVDATVTAGPGRRFTAAISLATGSREDRRTLTADRCAALVDAAALLIAVAIDEQGASAPAPVDAPGDVAPTPGDAHTDPATRAQAGEVSGDAAPTSGEVAPRSAGPNDAAPAIETPNDAAPAIATPAAMPPRPQLGGFVRAQGGLALGTVPGPAGAASLALGLLWRRVRLEFQPLFVAPRTDTREGHELRAWLIAAAVSGCLRVGPRALEVPLCGGLEGGVMRGIATGPDGVRGASGGWLAVLVGTGLVWRVHPRVGLWLGVEGTGAVRRPKFLLSGAAGEVELFKPLPVTLRVLLGIELRFGDPR